MILYLVRNSICVLYRFNGLSTCAEVVPFVHCFGVWFMYFVLWVCFIVCLRLDVGIVLCSF